MGACRWVAWHDAALTLRILLPHWVVPQKIEQPAKAIANIAIGRIEPATMAFAFSHLLNSRGLLRWSRQRPFAMMPVPATDLFG